MTDPIPWVDDVLRRWSRGGDLCAPFTELLPVSGASISMFGSRGTHSTVCASDPLATALDELQLRLGEGPRWQLVRSGLAVVDDDLTAAGDAAWPVFGADAAELGVCALFAFPIAIGGTTIGAVDLYRLTPGALSADDTSRARSLTRMVAAPAVERAVRSAGRHDSGEHAGAPALRREVHQATGMVVVQLDVSAAEAFVLLKAHAFATERPLDDVAADVVGRRLDFRDLDASDVELR